MNLVKSVLSVIVLITLTSLPVFANDAGCGLGGLVISKNTKLSQSLAVTTNATLFSQLLGITFGTSGCSANGFVMREKEAEHFAEGNMSNLKIEMARGNGESLMAFAEIMGCKGQAAQDFTTMTHQKFQRIFTSSDVQPAQMIHNVQGEMIKNQSLLQSCNSAI